MHPEAARCRSLYRLNFARAASFEEGRTEAVRIARRMLLKAIAIEVALDYLPPARLP